MFCSFGRIQQLPDTSAKVAPFVMVCYNTDEVTRLSLYYVISASFCKIVVILLNHILKFPQFRRAVLLTEYLHAKDPPRESDCRALGK